MKKQNPQEINALIELFYNSPKDAYKKFVSSNLFSNENECEKFWNLYSTNIDSLCKSKPNSISVFVKMKWLKLFSDLLHYTRLEKQKQIEELVKLNPSLQDFTEALFLSIEIEDSFSEYEDSIGYSENSLTAIKVLLKELSPKLQNGDSVCDVKDLVENAGLLIMLQFDIDLIIEFQDIFIWGGFQMSKLDNGFLLGLDPKISKYKNPYILNNLKESIKREIKSKESQNRISDEEHFKKIDPVLKTDQGLATIFISGGTVTSQPEGTTFIKVDEDYFNDCETDTERLFKVNKDYNLQKFPLSISNGII